MEKGRRGVTIPVKNVYSIARLQLADYLYVSVSQWTPIQLAFNSKFPKTHVLYLMESSGTPQSKFKKADHSSIVFQTL